MVTDQQVVDLYQTKSIRTVAKETGLPKETVRKIIHAAGATRKNTGMPIAMHAERANRCGTIKPVLRDFLDGLVISDGHLRSSSVSAKYQQDCVHEEWLRAIKKTFSEHNIQSRVSPSMRDGVQDGFALRTLAYHELRAEHSRWYPDGVKRVPHDINFSSPALWKNWIMGDGTLDADCNTLRLCTDDFLVDDIEWMLERILQCGYCFKKVFMGKAVSGKPKYRLSLNGRSAIIDLFQFVGSCDVPCFNYKWPKQSYAKLIAVAGQLANGKDVAADYIVRVLNKHKRTNQWRRTAFAAKIKEIFADTFGVKLSWIEKYKRVPQAPNGFLKPIRQCLIDIGDGFRQMRSDVWIRAALNRKGQFVISDGRYPNELEAVKSRGGINILLYRPGHRNNIDNASEQALVPHAEKFLKAKIDGATGDPLIDYFVINDSPTVDGLYAKLDKLVLPGIMDWLKV